MAKATVIKEEKIKLVLTVEEAEWLVGQLKADNNHTIRINIFNELFYALDGCDT